MGDAGQKGASAPQPCAPVCGVAAGVDPQSPALDALGAPAACWAPLALDRSPAASRPHDERVSNPCSSCSRFSVTSRPKFRTRGHPPRTAPVQHPGAFTSRQRTPEAVSYSPRYRSGTAVRLRSHLCPMRPCCPLITLSTNADLSLRRAMYCSFHQAVTVTTACGSSSCSA